MAVPMQANKTPQPAMDDARYFVNDGAAEAYAGITLQRDPQNNMQIRTPEETAPPRNLKNTVRRAFQEASPAWLVNNAVRGNSVIRAAGDVLNIMSGLKVAQSNGSYARVRAGAVSAVGSFAGTVFSQKEQNQETIDRYNQMSLPQYTMTRAKQIFQPHEHITQTIGATVAANGLWTVESGLRFLTKSYSAEEVARVAHQSELMIPFLHSKMGWKPTILKKGVLESARGIWTLFGAAGLIFAKNEANAWQVFTSVMTARTSITIAQGVESSRKDGDNFNGAYTATNLTANAIGFLYGGVKKYPDGTIIEVKVDQKGAQPVDDVQTSNEVPEKQIDGATLQTQELVEEQRIRA